MISTLMDSTKNSTKGSAMCPRGHMESDSKRIKCQQSCRKLQHKAYHPPQGVFGAASPVSPHQVLFAAAALGSCLPLGTRPAVRRERCGARCMMSAPRLCSMRRAF